MTRNSKALIIAPVLIALLAGGYWGASVYQRSKVKPPVYNYPSREYITLTSFDRDELVRMDLPEKGVSLERRGDLWEAVPAFPGPLNQSELSSLLWSLSSLQAERVIDEAPQEPGLYGLDVPAGRIILTMKDGERIELLGGSQSPSGSGYYVMMGGDPRVYLVSSYSGSAIYLDPARIRERAVSGSFAPAEVEHFLMESEKFRLDITLKGADSPLIAPFSSHVMNVPYSASRGVDSEKFGALLEAFQNLQVQDFVDPRPESLKPYGLDKPVRFFIQTANETIDLLLGNSAAGQLYAQRRGEAEVFTIPDAEVLRTASPFFLADKFALIININDVDSVTVRGGGPALTGEIRRQGEEETFFLNGKQAEEKSFKGWYQTVIGLLIDAEHPQRPQRGENAEITVEYSLNKPAGAKASIRLIPYNRDFYALESGGAVEFLISRVQVRTLYETAEKLTYVE